MENLSKWKASIRNYRLLIESIIVFTVSFITQLKAFLASPLLPGIDGPYYAVQVEWLLKYGTLKYPDPPLAFLLMSLFKILLGDTFLAVKVCVSFFTSLASIAILLVAKWVYRDDFTAVLAAFVFSLNFYTFRLLGDFMKNSIGLFWLILYIYTLTKCLENPSRKLYLTSLLFYILTALTHILDYGYAVAFTLIFISLNFKKFKNLYPILVYNVLALASFFAVPAIVGGDVWKGVSLIKDVLEASSTTTVETRYRPLFLPSIVFLVVMVAYWFIRKDIPRFTLLSTILAIGILFSLPWLPRQWFFRLHLMSCIPLAFGMAVPAYFTRLEKLFQLPIILSIVALTIFFNPLIKGLRPSISPGEYMEIKTIAKLAEKRGVNLVIPNARIRYWVEVYYEKVYRSPWQVKNFWIVLEKHRKPPKPIIIVYEGKFLIAFKPFKPRMP